jgi:FMN phosphatase YigB (HAD superfamily)
MRLIVYIDLDSTLLDVLKVKECLWQACELVGIPKDTAQKIYAASRLNRPFTPSGFATQLWPDQLSVRRSFLGLFSRLLAKENFLFYPGARKFLDTVAKFADVNLLTYGDKRFQLRKLRKCNIRPYFHKMIFAQKPDKTLEIHDIRLQVAKSTKIVIIDDSIQVVAQARKEGLLAIKVKPGFKTKNYFQNLEMKVRKVYERN